MADIQFIIGKLAAPPFSMAGLSMISFSEQSPQELLQLLSDVLAKISPKALLQQRAAGQQETPQQVAERLAFVLRLTKFPTPPGLDGCGHTCRPTFRQLLAAGDRDTLHGVLKWVLSQAQATLEKRAFVGFHLSLPEMPDELFYDPQAVELRGEVKALQADFVAAHRALDAAQDGVRGLPALRAQIQSMQDEQERLADKVDRAAAQAAALSDAASYRDVCTALRQEHDREVAISQQLMAQQQQLERAEAACSRSMARLHEVQQQLQAHGGGSDGGQQLDGGQLLDALRDDVARLRLRVSAQWPRELEAKQVRLTALQAVLGNGISTEGDLQRLLAQEAGLRQAVAGLTERLAATERARASDRAFLPVRQAQQMAALVGRKKGELAAKVERLREREAALQAGALAAAAAAGGAAATAGGAADVSAAAWQAKYDAVKAQLPGYRAMKAELAALEAEACVLQHTLDTLRAQDAARQRPMTTGEAAAAALYAMPAAGTTDEELRVLAAIKQHKASMAPTMQELRAARAQQQELEAVHAEKKAAHDAALGALEGSVAGLQDSVAGLQQQVDTAATDLEAARSRAAVLEQHVQLIASVGADEAKRRCQAQLAEAESTLQTLREQQRLAADRSSHGQAQAAMLEGLLRVLEAKAAAAAASAAAASSAQQQEQLQGRDALLSAGRWAPARGGGGGAGSGGANVLEVL